MFNSKKTLKYLKCNKCGAVCSVEENITLPIMCTTLVDYRTSGICGGSYELPTTKKEFDKQFES